MRAAAPRTAPTWMEEPGTAPPVGVLLVESSYNDSDNSEASASELDALVEVERVLEEFGAEVVLLLEL